MKKPGHAHDKAGTLVRYLAAAVMRDALADGKMAFISGPRQAGKTTMGRSLLSSPQNEYNWDVAAFRRRWVRDPLESVSSRGEGPILLDEIHKDRRWKSRLKGLYDLHGGEIPVLVTGSARLDFYRRSGDSLMGRYLPYRLHPFSVGIFGNRTPVFPFADMLRLGTFPEPLLGGHANKARRWSRIRLERLVYEDMRDLRHVHDIQALRVLVDMLPERVGGLLSVNSLKEDVGIAYATVRDWMEILEVLYYVILIKPYAGKIRRTLRAEPKLYLYDILQVPRPGPALENLAALHLLKACHFWTDLAYGEFELRYLRTKEKEEVDFVVTRDRRPWMLVECKSGRTEPNTTLVKFAGLLKTRLNFQLVDRRGHDRWYSHHHVRVIDYERFFSGLV
jgi:predicted AAA+ superfamily ATPase